MAQTFIGRVISLTSLSDIRYTGILEGIDQQNSTITLKNVVSMGTEFRRPPGTPDHIAPSLHSYEQIVFKAANVKDISVDDVAPKTLPNDPAVLSGQPAQVNQAPYPAYAQTYGTGPQARALNGNQATGPTQQANQQSSQTNRHQRQQGQPTPPPDGTTSTRQHRGNRGGQNGARGTDAPHVNGSSGGGRRGGAQDKPVPVTVPDTDFDFQQNNARFNKAALSPARVDDDQKTNPSDSDGESKSKENDKYYNPKASFFDSLSTSAPPPQGPRGGNRRGRGGGRGRNRREEEREKNISTFGEPGGVGILGAGAYVGGWGSGGHGGRRNRGGNNTAPNGVVSGGTSLGAGVSVRR